MHSGKLVFAQLMEFFPRHDFDKCVRRYRGNYRTRDFSCRDQFLAMAFAQLTYRESLRDIETCLRSVQPKLYHMGFRGPIARSTMADANGRNRSSGDKMGAWHKLRSRSGRPKGRKTPRKTLCHGLSPKLLRCKTLEHREHRRF